MVMGLERPSQFVLEPQLFYPSFSGTLAPCRSPGVARGRASRWRAGHQG